MELENNVYFWQKLDTLVLSSSVQIDRRKGTSHPEHPNLVYPTDYGSLKDTLSSDREEIDVFVGSGKYARVNTIMVAVDVLRKDLEVKVLLGCTEKEEEEIKYFLNQTDYQKTIIVHRGDEVPEWGESDS